MRTANSEELALVEITAKQSASLLAPTLRCPIKKKRPFLKWAGGKYSLLNDIHRYLPESDCLVEPFVGAGALFLNSQFQRYILADINQDLINLYQTLKLAVDTFICDAKQLFINDNNQAEQFYHLRNEFNQSQDHYYRALLFFYLNRHCYNGLCRFNLKGLFNVPFGRYKRIYFPEEELLWFAEKAQNAQFFCQSYQQTLLMVPKGAVVYCDPPYAPLSNTANFTAYHTNQFAITEQQQLASLAKQVAEQQRATLLISNHDTNATRQWYNQANYLYSVQAKRTISSKSTGRVKVNELLALYTPPNTVTG